MIIWINCEKIYEAGKIQIRPGKCDFFCCFLPRIDTRIVFNDRCVGEFETIAYFAHASHILLNNVIPYIIF